MSDLLFIDILADRNHHRDLLVRLKGLVQLTLDTYYFALALAEESDPSLLRRAVTQLLHYWLASLPLLATKPAVYLPIDFSDQYVGCFKVERQAAFLRMSYGWCQEEDFGVNPLNPGDFCTTAVGFKQREPTYLLLPETELLAAVSQQISRLALID